MPMDELSGRIAEAVGHPVPHADPDYGGTRARALLLLCDPAPKTDHEEGSGYISPDNDDATAERVHDLLAANRIAPEDVVTLNVVPWLRPGAAGQSLAVDDRDEGNRWLGELLELLPRLRVVAVLGRDAQKSLLRATAPPLTSYARIDAPHPGRRSQNNAELRSALDAAFVDVVRGVAGELPPTTVLDHWPDDEP